MRINYHDAGPQLSRDTVNRASGASYLPALSGLTSDELRSWTDSRGLPAFRSRQIWDAVHRRSVQQFDAITDLPARLRGDLAASFRLRTLEPRVHLHSSRDGAEKVLFNLTDGSTVETVLIRGRNAGASPRHTVCVSSQVGCPAACTFCATGLSGFTRNLRAAEIVDQVAYFSDVLQRHEERVTNVVFMGMGEPLLNTAAVRAAVAALIDPCGPGMGARRITVSTVGIVPQVEQFAGWAGEVNLAVSLHAPNNELRSQLVPYNRHFPIESLMDAVTGYIRASGRRVSFEYVLLRGVNDAPSLASELAALLAPFGGMAHVNLIPWNPFREGRFIRSEGPDADAFAVALRQARVNATIRYSKGLDISAACGQLREAAAAVS